MIRIILNAQASRTAIGFKSDQIPAAPPGGLKSKANKNY
jgi:hypothetical protein